MNWDICCPDPPTKCAPMRAVTLYKEPLSISDNDHTLISRWMMPLEWMCDTPSASWRKSLSAS